MPPVVTKSKSDVKENRVKVFCRLRPLADNKDSTCVKLIKPTILHLTPPYNSKIQRNNDMFYEFEHIFNPKTSQNEVFERVALPLLQNLLEGKNGLLLGYGVTGSGKTHTITGNYDTPGLIPLCINTIFNSIENSHTPKYLIKPDKMNGFDIQSESDAAKEESVERQRATTKNLSSTDASFTNNTMHALKTDTNSRFAIFISYIEIYNNAIFDLLDETSHRGKSLRQDSNKNFYVNGMVEIETKTAQEVFHLFDVGEKRKKMGETALNAESSRSHSIFKIRVARLKSSGDSNTSKRQISELNIVDLAGSARTARTQNTGQMLKESCKINNSLMTLRSCLNVLRENQMTGGNNITPCRESRLTTLLKNYFEGEGCVEMIICVNPSVNDFDENVYVMKFAKVARDVKITLDANSKSVSTVTLDANPKSVSTSTSPKMLFTPSTPRKIQTNNDEGELLPINLNFNNVEESDAKLEEFSNNLKLRMLKGMENTEELSQRCSRFRNVLCQVEHDFNLNKSDSEKVQSLQKKEKKRLAQAESVNNNELRVEVMELRNMLTEKDVEIRKLVSDKEHKRSERLEQDKEIVKLREEVHRLLESNENDELRPKSEDPTSKTGQKLKKRRSRSVGEIMEGHSFKNLLPSFLKKYKSTTKIEEMVVENEKIKYSLFTSSHAYTVHKKT